MRRITIVFVLFAALLMAQSGPVVSRITHGPMLGRVGSDHIGVWARTSRGGEFRVFYGTSPDDLDQMAGPVDTRLADDYTGWALIEGLEPDTKYYYEVATTEEPARAVNRTGHFHTLPSPDSVRDAETNPEGLFNFRFDFATGNNQRTSGGTPYGPSLPTYQTMLRELIRDDEKSKVDFSILNGDWLYEEDRTYPVEAWRHQTGIEPAATPREVSLMPYVVGVWENFKTFLELGVPMATYHRYVPSYYTFDDHEILSDVYESGEVGTVNRKSVFRDVALTAWYDYLGWTSETGPTQGIVFGKATFEAGSDVLTDPEADFSELSLDELFTLHVHWGENAGEAPGVASVTEGGDPNSGVYEIVEVLGDHRLRLDRPAKADGSQTYSIGRRSYFKKRVANVDLFFLDTRSNREAHDVRNPMNPGRSMIGARQREWLMDEMRASDADFTFVVSSVNFTIPHIGGNKSPGPRVISNKDDAWTVFQKDRDELIQFWDELGKPVFVLTGDLHNSFAIKITDNVWEFAAGPHNSVQHPLSSEGDRPPNGKFEYNGREVEIRWSSFSLPDTPVPLRNRVLYCVVRINNVWRNPKQEGVTRWVAYPRPQAIFQYYDGLTGDLLYAESILAAE